MHVFLTLVSGEALAKLLIYIVIMLSLGGRWGTGRA